MTTATAPTTDRTLRVTCESVYGAAVYNELWKSLASETGRTLESLRSVHHNAGNCLQRLLDTQPQDGPISSRLVDARDTHYFRDKGWKLEITIQNPSVDDCTIILPPPTKPPVKKKK